MSELMIKVSKFRAVYCQFYNGHFHEFFKSGLTMSKCILCYKADEILQSDTHQVCFLEK